MQKLPAHEITRIRLTPTPILQHVTLPVRLPILMYHYIEVVTDTRDTMRKSLAILPAVFDKQVKTLKEAGYTFLTASQIPAILDGKLALPEKPIILTFDDGYRDFYTDAYPILKKYQVPATAYVVPGFLDKPNYLFKTQLDEINKDGLVEIAAHTVHHVYLKGMNAERARVEIQQSKTELEQAIQKPVVSFAYPYGAFDLEIAKQVEAAGFTNAVSTLPGVELDGKNTYFIFRVRPGARTGKELLTFLQQSTYRPY
jgi:peptidoglycan/xylan/chitin deacetylase (PgdA/CDA1 family)